ISLSAEKLGGQNQPYLYMQIVPKYKKAYGTVSSRDNVHDFAIGCELREKKNEEILFLLGIINILFMGHFRPRFHFYESNTPQLVLQDSPETVSTNSEKIKSHSGAESTTFSSQVDVSLSGTKNHEADDKVSLTLLLVSGKRHTFSFDPNDTILTVKQKVFSNWPKEWADETPSSISSLKIVYRGRFLEDISTLE
ncbi:7186_t:CDS:2, partial [Entrophospora sp. SA101]